MARRLCESLTLVSDASADRWPGRITLDLLKRYPSQRLPFTLAPRYKALFGKRVHRRRQDLDPAAVAA
jgi:hypothetical protein